MATRGPKPKAQGRLKVVGGTDAPSGGDGGGRDIKITAPSYLNALGRAKFLDLAPQLVERFQYLPQFETELARYCAAYSQWREALKHVQAGRNGVGMIQTTPNGFDVKSVWLQIHDKAQEIMGKIAADFGLNPVSQVRIDGVQLDFMAALEPKKSGTDDKPGGWGGFE